MIRPLGLTSENLPQMHGCKQFGTLLAHKRQRRENHSRLSRLPTCYFVITSASRDGGIWLRSKTRVVWWCGVGVNPRPLAPHASALPDCATSRKSSVQRSAASDQPAATAFLFPIGLELPESTTGRTRLRPLGGRLRQVAYSIDRQGRRSATPFLGHEVRVLGHESAAP